MNRLSKSSCSVLLVGVLLVLAGCQTASINGHSALTLENGDGYVGEFKNGKYQGQGTLTFANGSKYAGEF